MTLSVAFVGSSTQIVPSTMRPISRSNYLKKAISVISVTSATWHDFCTIIPLGSGKKTQYGARQ
ncbi:hypothetical protein CN074_30985 [Sinorhizobium medicae]|nr:hypothetical protein CN201_21970 [Sinorhizobium medicae]RVP60059.1 hypothetical protein CN074_30985 [Sinorhizobium medicae]